MNLIYPPLISLLLIMPGIAFADLPTSGGSFKCTVEEVYAGKSATWQSSAVLPLRVSRGVYDPIAGTNYFKESIIFASRLLPTNIDIEISFNQFVCGSHGSSLVEFPCNSMGYTLSVKKLDQSLHIPPADFYLGQKSGTLSFTDEFNKVEVKFRKEGFDYSADINCLVYPSY